VIYVRIHFIYTPPSYVSPPLDVSFLPTHPYLPRIKKKNRKMTLTTHLQTLHIPLYKTATTHPFLTQAAHGQIPKPLLSQWLSQDRLYAQSYIRFIGALLSKTRLSNHPGTATASVESRVVDLLIDALVNIRRELGVFGDVAGEFGLDLMPSSSSSLDDGDGDGTGFEANPITHSYIDLFMSASSPATSLLEGMVVLWATEICYLRAWQYARTTSATSPTKEVEEDADGGALRKHFIPNWTSAEFEAFVVRIGDVVDEMAEGCENREDVLGRCAVWWRQILYLEGRFWPDVSA
jgi:thiaminase